MLKKQKAFTLLEVLTAILLISGLMSIIIQISYGNVRRAKKVKQLAKIAYLLEIKMLNLEQEFGGKNIVNLLKEDQGEFEEDKNYTWFYTTQKLELPPKERILSLLSLPDSEINQQWIDVFSTLISETIIELKLTVSYDPPRGKGLSYSLSSYFVDYAHAPGFILNQISSKIPLGASPL